MRAFGPGSVSSFLKIVLDVVFAALWVAVVAVSLIALAGAVLALNPGLLDQVAVDAGDLTGRWPGIIGSLIAAALSIAAVLVIVGVLRRIFATLTAGDPFHPHNVGRLRLIGVMLAVLEVGRYVVRGVLGWLLPGAVHIQGGVSVTAWFSVLVVFVLAEVFREGARLRREAELTI